MAVEITSLILGISFNERKLENVFFQSLGPTIKPNAIQPDDVKCPAQDNKTYLVSSLFILNISNNSDARGDLLL